ncbi:MAG: DUF6261 family protein [Tannerella sp.]|jgi:hypothetical protein|nr:DUF6261 family protein [Tannerella sp.]
METFIERFRITALRNMEFTLVVPRIVSIVESHDPAALRLANRLEAVKSFLPDLEKIEAQERKWSDAALMEGCEDTRDDMVNTLIHVERAYARVHVPGFEEASLKLTALFDKHKRDIAVDNRTSETQRIYNLVEDIERTPGFQENVLDVFSLRPVFQAMKEANIRFDELWLRRNRELSEVEKVDSKAIRVKCGKAVSSLYEGIEFYAAEYGEAEYQALIRELNKLSAYYKQQIKARITRQRNAGKNAGKPNDEELIKPPAGDNEN